MIFFLPDKTWLLILKIFSSNIWQNQTPHMVYVNTYLPLSNHRDKINMSGGYYWYNKIHIFKQLQINWYSEKNIRTTMAKKCTLGHVYPVKLQISMRICVVWAESSLGTLLDSFFMQKCRLPFYESTKKKKKKKYLRMLSAAVMTGTLRVNFEDACIWLNKEIWLFSNYLNFEQRTFLIK